MLYAILAYHEEHIIQGWTEAEDAELMAGLNAVHDRLTAAQALGPAARLGATADACTIRGGDGRPVVVDGPFAETKEQLLGFYVVDAASRDEAVQAALDLRSKNPTAVYEVRPILLYLPGQPFPVTESEVYRPR
ncbi:YciI family protein [Phenylobacterium sp. J367]|uniref:YciI family protein n=1 Tax=Phenylobacterium sp. J367 TaxID=2898435 RepID=UPI002151E013|nr:YciI family protein [Phenylobacterium sp. J367]MCR5878928.1 YciI family protein [Phenylobacterium sp. J367]